MRIGSMVIYQGARYRLCGLDPMGVPERRAEIQDVRTGKRFRVPVAELKPA